jgi:FlaA1/EpsC-like NDP-sugar epimerase
MRNLARAKPLLRRQHRTLVHRDQHVFYVKRVLIVIHDLIVTALAICAALYIRFDNAAFLAKRLHWLVYGLPFFLVMACGVYAYFRLYTSKWRFASLPDLWNIVKAVTVLTLALLIFDYILVSPRFYGDLFFGKVTIGVYWLVQIFLLGGPRVGYRLFRHHRTRVAAETGAIHTLALGRAVDAEILIRAVESGAVKKTRIVGILSPSSADQRQVLRGIKVLGYLGDLEEVIRQLQARGRPVQELVFTPSALLPENQPDTLLNVARRTGLAVRKLPSLEARGEIRLTQVNVEDLLLRPSVSIDYERLRRFVRGKAVIVTGGGGSIGSELCDRILSFDAARVLILDCSEHALYSVMELLKTKAPHANVEGRIADVRDRERMFRLFGDFRPDLVFHSAALKHVPILEDDCEEGIRTNVFGTVNVADAAAAAQASALVMISTDKAIEPVSVLGASKRLAEIYCQALDATLASKTAANQPRTQLISVRFGNVLASNGSVVPKFKAQIEAGGPVTVTHPDMVRYFMTIKEACDLVITACSHALGSKRSAAAVYVLEMGQPVKILDLAQRMIKLSGLDPDRDIEIIFTGVRPGERLHEILFARREPTIDIGLSGVMAAEPIHASLPQVQHFLDQLQQTIAINDRAAVLDALQQAVPDFKRAESQNLATDLDAVNVTPSGVGGGSSSDHSHYDIPEKAAARR